MMLFNELYALGAVEDFDSDDIAVDAGDTKRDVIVSMHIKPSGAMSKLYMTVHVGQEGNNGRKSIFRIYDSG